MSKRAGWIVLAIGFGLAGSGCGDSVDPISNGSLLAAWEVRPRGCDSAGLKTVEARVESDRGRRAERFDCSNGKGAVENLRPGNYELALVGLDGDGDPTFDAGPREVTVRGSRETTAPEMQLTARPAEVEVAWRFENGRVCGTNGVDKVTVVLYDEDDFKVASRQLQCERGETTLEEIPPGEYLVDVRSAERPEEGWIGFKETTLQRGETGSAEVVLKPAETVDRTN